VLVRARLCTGVGKATFQGGIGGATFCTGLGSPASFFIVLGRVVFWLWQGTVEFMSWLGRVGFWVGFRTAEFLLWLARGRFWTVLARAGLVKADLGSGLAGPRFRAQFGIAGFGNGAAFCRAGFLENIGDKLARASFRTWLGTGKGTCRGSRALFALPAWYSWVEGL